MADIGEPTLKKMSTHLDQIVRDAQRDIPITLPDGTILIEAVQGLQTIIDDLEARVFKLENP